MKRLRALCVLLFLGAALSGCADNGNETVSQEESVTVTETPEASTPVAAETPESNQSTEPTKILIAYFSLWGNTAADETTDATTSASILEHDGVRMGTTEAIADMIQSSVGGDKYLIQTVNQYPLDFNEVIDLNHEEQDSNARPELQNQVDLSQYDTIFIGYPVWSSTTPTPVLTFLEEYDLSGKTVIPFCTHDGHGQGRSFSAIQDTTAQAVHAEGLAIDSQTAAAAEEDVRNWLDSLNLTPETVQSAVTPIRITIGDHELTGELNDTPEAQAFISMLPQTISMVQYGGREYYGGIDGEIEVSSEGYLNFENGDITYCPTNNTAAIFYAQTDRPDLTMEVFKIGKVTSDLSAFDEMERSVTIQFELE